MLPKEMTEYPHKQGLNKSFLVSPRMRQPPTMQHKFNVQSNNFTVTSKQVLSSQIDSMSGLEYENQDEGALASEKQMISSQK